MKYVIEVLQPLVTQIHVFRRLHQWVRPQLHPTLCPVLAVKLLGIMFRNRCWPTTSHTITTGDAAKSGRCDQPLRREYGNSITKL